MNGTQRTLVHGLLCLSFFSTVTGCLPDPDKARLMGNEAKRIKTQMALDAVRATATAVAVASPTVSAYVQSLRKHLAEPPTQLQRWQYVTLPVGVDLFEPDGVEALNIRAKEGWDLLAIVTREDGFRGYVAVWRRPYEIGR